MSPEDRTSTQYTIDALRREKSELEKKLEELREAHSELGKAASDMAIEQGLIRGVLDMPKEATWQDTYAKIQQWAKNVVELPLDGEEVNSPLQRVAALARGYYLSDGEARYCLDNAQLLCQHRQHAPWVDATKADHMCIFYTPSLILRAPPPVQLNFTEACAEAIEREGEAGPWAEVTYKDDGQEKTADFELVYIENGIHVRFKGTEDDWWGITPEMLTTTWISRKGPS